jgi:hypothetical protein
MGPRRSMLRDATLSRSINTQRCQITQKLVSHDKRPRPYHTPLTHPLPPTATFSQPGSTVNGAVMRTGGLGGLGGMWRV